MVECAEKGAPAPPELRTAWECQRWETLPEAGGYYDQDFVLLSRMTAAVNVYNVLVKMRSLKGSQIHNLTDSDRRLLRTLKDLGLIFNG